MKTLCYSVRLASLTEISVRCYKARAFDGSEALIPKSQVFGEDWDVQKSNAYWISAWILERKNLQFSDKKKAWFNPETADMEPHYVVEKHQPEIIQATEINADESLKR
ncbi:MAG TPA: hypothetical protein DCQ31_13240 [Bacteroidales bacterium]|nr:hypothetical protein [Bacteroidales bacterium]